MERRRRKERKTKGKTKRKPNRKTKGKTKGKTEGKTTKKTKRREERRKMCKESQWGGEMVVEVGGRHRIEASRKALDKSCMPCAANTRPGMISCDV